MAYSSTAIQFAYSHSDQQRNLTPVGSPGHKDSNSGSLTSPMPSSNTCLPGADSGSSLGGGGGSIHCDSNSTASPVVSPQGLSAAAAAGHLGNFSAASLSGMAVAAAAASAASSTGHGGSSSAAAAAALAAGMSDQMSSQLLSDCDSARLAALSYSRLPTGGLGSMYSATYPSTDQNPYPSISMENSFYGPLGNPYAMKDGAAGAEMAAWSSAAALPPTAGYYSYDHPTLAAYGYGSGYDLAARRKNATRESTATLKAWLNEHKKNPYPTKGEKIMLAIITKMTLTQVSTWFANARRRLKKENKMTWEPKNKLDDEDVDVSDDDDKDVKDDDLEDHRRELSHHHHHLSNHLHQSTTTTTTASGLDDGKSGIPIPPSKPKIWSLADTAVCKTPPPPSSSLSAGLGGNHHHLNSMSHQFGMGQPGSMGGMGAGQPSWSAGGFDRSMSAFRGNAFGMGPMAGMMGLPGMALGGHRPDFGGMMGGLSGSLAAAAAAAQLPAGSPGLMNHGSAGGGSDLQTDTPPHTPPTGKGNCPRSTNSSTSSSYLYNNGNNSLSNGYSSAGNLSPGQVDPSKLLNFPSSSAGPGHLGAFKMM